MIVYLLGYMGSGKSKVGRKLANQLNWDLIDLDTAIEEKEQKSIEQIFQESGEEYFRQMESEVLRNIQTSSNTIVSCGGGAPCYYENMVYMNHTGYTIYLEMTPQALLSRLKNSKKRRPLVEGLDDKELLKFVQSSLANREVWYDMAKLRVEGLDPDINRLCAHLQAQSPYNP